MDFKNFTIKAQEAVQKATEMAGANQQQAVETGHLLKGIFQSDESVFSFLANKLGANLNILTPRLDALVAAYPKRRLALPVQRSQRRVAARHQLPPQSLGCAE
ncbi:Clp protease N-terminal domain-containing protein [Hymenobacter elongatus]|uniref:Clp protease N-terminal domain-containing protein n=1 Tax=Hymenobacter elongatus TaxID=877208 RepID=UPI001FD8840B|nr:Clp protease N-terminal domain-containing protein [Hymenobacter elongatus]